MKILTVVGARPNFIKAAPVSAELQKSGIKEILVHTGQHYDTNMSADFFFELCLPCPDYNLETGSGTHGMQTGRMLEALEEVMLREKPNLVLVYGDTNSTLAGALAAAKLHIPVAHVEAGIRSYNRAMAEEMNRKLTDHISTVLLCPTKQAVINLESEGFNSVLNCGQLPDAESLNKIRYCGTPVVMNTGDVMYDMVCKTKSQLEVIWSWIKDKYNISGREYILATIHRPENTDKKEHLKNILEGLGILPLKTIWPLHPRTAKALTDHNLWPYLDRAKNILAVEPVGYSELLTLVKNAQCTFTDSGGIQKEAYMLGVPCLTCRNDTEWPQTVTSGWNKLIGLGASRLLEAYPFGGLPKERPDWFGDGCAAQRIVMILNNLLSVGGVD